MSVCVLMKDVKYIVRRMLEMEAVGKRERINPKSKLVDVARETPSG